MSQIGQQDVTVTVTIKIAHFDDKPPELTGKMTTRMSGQKVQDAMNLPRGMLDIFMAWHTAMMDQTIGGTT